MTIAELLWRIPQKKEVVRPLFSVVRERGLEPPRAEAHQPLKLTRLPIPPLARIFIM